MELSSVIKTQREFFNKDTTKSIGFRKNALEKLLESVYENEPAIYAALKSDLGKSEMEAYMTEVSQVIHEIKYAIKHLESWAKPKKVKTPLALMPGKSKIVREPYGVALIMAPWNYPFQLALVPLIGAIAGGNCAILKTSKSSPCTSGVVVDIINSTFDRNYVYAIDEIIPYDEILKQKYDYMFFTGSERIGKTVMRAAAENLTPVTLELGGKSPCIVDSNADVDRAARKIMWGKILNAGQTCVAPDYAFVHENVKEEFIHAAKKYAKEMVDDPFVNEDYPHIISLHHFIRLKNIIERESQVIGGRYDDKKLIIEPTILPEANFESMAMKSEIFGPILPIITYDDIGEVKDILKNSPKPLALYVFSKDKYFVEDIINNISFGGGCINDVIFHLANENLPFGGVGSSGMGNYHGKAGFDTFTHEKSIYSVKASFDVDFRYPPYKKETLNFIKKF